MSDDDKKKGLYPKYKIDRINDPDGKHDKCFFFVLDLDHDPFAYPAIAAYIQHCKKDYPLLAAELALEVVVRTKYRTFDGGGLIDVRPK